MNRNPAASKALGRVIRTYRVAKGLSQEKLGHLANVDRTYVGSVERGERNPSFENIWMLLYALGVSWTDFGAALDEQPALRRRPVTRNE